jgi:hypothetical protein
MKYILLIVLFLFVYQINGQTAKHYEKFARKNKSFYKERVDIWMKGYSYLYNVKNWNLKKVKIDFSPEEGAFYWKLTKEEISNLSQHQKDSILFSAWEQTLYQLNLPVTFNDGTEEVFRFWLDPNGNIDIKGRKDYINCYGDSALPLFYIEKDEKP